MVLQRLIVFIRYGFDIIAIFIFLLPYFQNGQCLFVHLLFYRTGIEMMVVEVPLVLVFIQLQPKVFQRMRRLVVISNEFLSIQSEVLRIQGTFDVVVRPLLPIFWAGRSVNAPIWSSRWEYGIELFKGFAVVGGLLGK